MATESKDQVNIRLTPTAKKILSQLSDVYGTAQGDVVELLLRIEAARLKLKGHERSPLRHGFPQPQSDS